MRMQQRRGLASVWATRNPILASGEIGLELDSGKMKYGDGTTPWNSLAYWSSVDGVAVEDLDPFPGVIPNDARWISFPSGIARQGTTIELLNQLGGFNAIQTMSGATVLDCVNFRGAANATGSPATLTLPHLEDDQVPFPKVPLYQITAGSVISLVAGSGAQVFGNTQTSDDRRIIYVEAIGNIIGTTFWFVSGSGILGPTSATDNNVVVADGTTGKKVKDGGATVAQIRDRTTHTGGGASSLRHTKVQAIPNNVWTNVAWNTADDAVNGMGSLVTANTTIAVGSNGVALPTGTIQVASTTGFSTGGGFLTIEGPPGASIITLVKYSGISGNSFTGCTLGSGTLATGQVVRDANAAISLPVAGRYFVSAQWGWATNATGKRGIKFLLAGFVDYGILEVNTTNTANQGTTTSWLFNTNGAVNIFVQVIQTSGGVLNGVADGLTLPTVTAMYLRGIS